ncbi:MAG: universal stress protein [Spirochaeta sp.]|nr:universal stress protein [Spirochaeta sp.]
MFKKFIVATDLSPASEAVVSCLSGIKALGGEHCVLFNCIRLSEAASTAYSYHYEQREESLARQKTLLEGQGFQVEVITTVGTAKREIKRFAVEEDCDLIVLGAQGNSLAEEKLLGGVAYGVINKSRKPVLVIPVEKNSDKDDLEPIDCFAFGDHVLFATDFSEMSDLAFYELEQLVADGVKKVTLVHVQDETKLDQHLLSRLEEFNEHDRHRLAELKDALQKKGNCEIDIEVCYGIPYKEITRLASERDVQMIVMGAQGRSFIGDIFLGSVSHRVIVYARVPVLLIPSSAQG